MKVPTEQNYILNAFQLRAARVTAGVSLSAIGNLLGFTKAAVSLWEHQNNLTQIRTSNDNVTVIKEFFAQHSIFFPDANSIGLKAGLIGKKRAGLTRFQLRAARAILHMSQEELAALINIPRYIIQKAELAMLNRYVHTLPPIESLPLQLRNFFEERNFIFCNDFIVSFYDNKKSS
ncbi:MAG: hypothetical protein ACRYE9_00620 [Janthinobacterium lividum]